MAAIKVSTRENPRGNYWCNTTYAGYDISAEGQSIADVQRLITEELHRQGQVEIVFEEPKPYPKKLPIVKPQITYARWRIDKDCIG